MIKFVLRSLTTVVGAACILAAGYYITINAHFHLYVLPEWNAERLAEGLAPLTPNFWSSLHGWLSVLAIGIGLLFIGLGGEK